MPVDLLISEAQHATASSAINLSFYLFGVVSATLVVGLATDPGLLLAAFPRLYDAVFSYLGRLWVSMAIMLIFGMLKLMGSTKDEDCPESGPGDIPLQQPEGLYRLSPLEISPDVWFDAAQSPPSGTIPTEDENDEVGPESGTQGIPPEQPKVLRRSSSPVVSPDVWYDAPPSPSFRNVPTENRRDKEISESGAAGILPKQPQVLRRSPPLTVFTDVLYDAEPSPPFRDVFIDSASTRDSSLKTAGSGSPGVRSDVSCQTTDFEDQAPPSSPAAAVVRKPVKCLVERSERAVVPVEEEHDSMEAMWQAINGSVPPTRRLKKNKTWYTPKRQQLEPRVEAAGRELRKSETFPESVAARRAVLERRMEGKEVEVAWDHDVMNRRFDAFIEDWYDRLKLERQQSLQRRRMEMVYSPGY